MSTTTSDHSREILSSDSREQEALIANHRREREREAKEALFLAQAAASEPDVFDWLNEPLDSLDEPVASEKCKRVEARAEPDSGELPRQEEAVRSLATPVKRTPVSKRKPGERLPTDTDRYSTFAHHVFQSPEFDRLRSKETRLAALVLQDMVFRAGFRGANNGHIVITKDKVKTWCSKKGLSTALQQLSDMGFIIKTRGQRWPKDPDLWALTFLPISDEVARSVGLRGGSEATHAWRSETPAYVSPRRKNDAHAPASAD